MKFNPVISPSSHDAASDSGHFVVCSRYLDDQLVTGILADVQMRFATVEVGSSELPVLMYRSTPALETLLNEVMSEPPDDRQVDSEQGAEYQFWFVRDPHSASIMQSTLDEMDAFYWIEAWVDSVPDDEVPREDYSHSQSVLLLSEDYVQPLSRNRLLADLGGMDTAEFLQRLHKCFNIRTAVDANQALPKNAREMGLYLQGHWYRLRLIEGTWNLHDPVKDLDVSVLNDNVFQLMLGIAEPELSARIGIADPVLLPQQLADLVDQSEWQAVFLLYPPSVESLMYLSDEGREPPAHCVEFGQRLPWITL